MLNHIDWEGRPRQGRTAIDLGCGAGNDTLELLRRGWNVLSIDGEEASARFLARRVPARHRSSLVSIVAPMEEVELPPADLVYASFSLPFCPPGRFTGLWANIRRAVRPGGHFAGQFFGDRDAWSGNPNLTFHSQEEVRRRARGFQLELLRETLEDGMSFSGPKQWHFFDVILGQPPRHRHRKH